MNPNQELHLAYVLHARPFRETSLLLEILSAEHGRVALVARGAKRGKAKSSSLLLPFMPLHVSWYGNGELATLTHVEMTTPSAGLYGRKAICGLYVNELLIKLLPKWDHCADLFRIYESTIKDLANESQSEQIVLRKFELQLLKSLGYGLQVGDHITAALNCGEFTDKEALKNLKITIREVLQQQLGARKIISRELL